MDATQIAQSMREEAARLSDLVITLVRCADVLEGKDAYDDLLAEADSHYAPYGYKADGTPRRRPPLSPEARAKATATRAARRAAKARQAKKDEVRLNVISSTTPTETELRDRKVAYTTSEPA